MSDDRDSTSGVLFRGGLLTASLAGLWLLLSAPAWWIAGWAGLEGLTIAAVLCLVPGWLVFLLASGYGFANFQAVAVLGGMTLRMLFVLAGTLIVLSTRSHLRLKEFVIWLLVFYLAALAVETGIVLKGRTQSS